MLKCWDVRLNEIRSDSSAGPLTVAATYYLSTRLTVGLVTSSVLRPLVSAKIFFSCEKSLSFMNIALLSDVVPGASRSWSMLQGHVVV